MYCCKREGAVLKKDIEFDSFVKKSLKEYFGHDFYQLYLSKASFNAANGFFVVSSICEKAHDFLSSKQSIFLEFIRQAWPTCTANVKFELNNCKNQPTLPFSSIESEANGHVIYADFNDSNYSFENFVEDRSNAHALERAVAFATKPLCREEGEVLSITGNVGYGKTHLARAIVQCANKNGIKTAYFTAESFSSAFVSSLREKKIFEFKNSILSRQMLVFDDINFLLGRKHTMEEFSNIVTTMHDNNKTIVVTTSQSLSGIEPRLRSRLNSGFSAIIKDPSSDLKRKIASRIVMQKNLPLSLDGIEFLATRITGGIRELKGAISRLASLHLKAAPTLDTITSVLSDLIIGDEIQSMQSGASVERIIASVCAYSGISHETLLSDNRVRNVVLARNVAMHLCKTILNMTYEQIAVVFSGRSHQAVAKGIYIINDALKQKNKHILEFVDGSKGAFSRFC